MTRAAGIGGKDPILGAHRPIPSSGIRKPIPLVVSDRDYVPQEMDPSRWMITMVTKTKAQTERNTNWPRDPPERACITPN